MNPSESYTWSELSDAAAIQYAEACSGHAAWIDARAHLAAFRGVAWQPESTAGVTSEILVRTDCQGNRTMLGRRSKGTQCVANSYALLERLAQQHFDELNIARRHHQLLSIDLELGQASVQLVQLLDTLQYALDGKPVTVLGPHALLGYAAAAGVTLSHVENMHTVGSADASLDLTLAVTDVPNDDKLEAALSLVDSTFVLDRATCTATSATGIEIRFVPRVAADTWLDGEAAGSLRRETSLPEHPARCDGPRLIHILSSEGEIVQIAVPGPTALIRQLEAYAIQTRDLERVICYRTVARSVEALCLQYLPCWPRC